MCKVVDEWTDEELDRRADQRCEIWLEKLRLARMYPDMTDDEIEEALR